MGNKIINRKSKMHNRYLRPEVLMILYIRKKNPVWEN